MTAFFPKKNFTHHISNSISVGFHPYGPTLTLGGVLSTPKKVFLIDHFSVFIIPPFQAEKKQFDWFTLQPHTALDGRFDIVNSPSKFVLSPGESHKYAIMFVDNDCYAQMKTVMLNIISSWQGLKENMAPNKTEEEAFSSFCQMPMTKGLNSMLQNLCYWDAGEYKLDICITTKEETFSTKKYFYLNDDNIEELKSNSSSIIASACGMPGIEYDMAKVHLVDK